MKRTTNTDCRALVRSRTPFQGSNLFAEQRGFTTPAVPRYIVYSYGHHWPLFIFVPKAALPDGTPCTSTLAGGVADGIWFENEEKSSRSTNRQRSQAHPRCSTVLLSCPAMKALAESGRVAHAIVLTAKQ